tara:strand:- start:77 stop:982 length:906 start_codon:yes stop_codon:yes gene_type:complete
MNWLEVVDEAGMFWQYPVRTEKQFCLQNNGDEHFVGFPWATVIDKNVTTDSVYNFLRDFIDPSKNYYTCCQHIYFRQLYDLFKTLGINVLYTPHKCLQENIHDDIELKSCPLYAVNIEDGDRNLEFSEVDLLKVERDLLFSFMGGYQYGYISDIRQRIFNLPSKENSVIENTGDWHFNEVVYSIHQSGQGLLNESETRRNNTRIYNDLLIRSRYSLCPSGSGPSSIRFWESLGSGSIPVLLADTLELPDSSRWPSSFLKIDECDIEQIENILDSISEEEEFQRRSSCLEMYAFYRENYRGL